MMNISKIIKAIARVNGVVLILVLLAFVLGWQVGQRTSSETSRVAVPQPQNLDFKLFWQTWDLLSKQYIDKKAIDPKKLYYGAIQGMVAAVGDPYTVFLPPESQKTTKEQLSGSFEGVGIQLGFDKDKRLVVIAPLKGTPADAGGVKAGDLILQIDGKDTTNLSLPDAVNKIRGVKGTAVTLSLYSEGTVKAREVKLVRDTIIIKSVQFEAKTTKSGKKVVYISLTSFGEKTNTEWNDAVNEVLTSSSQGVIVDVRNNPGGFLDAAVYIASEFLDGGSVVLQEDASGQKTPQSVDRVGRIFKLPLVILINKGSASASEILAGAIQDRGRGTLVGEQSFGKGTIQSAEDLPEGTGIHITTAKWLTPNGRWVHSVGLTPDIKVEIATPSSALVKPVDSQLDKALEILDQQP